MRLTFASGPRRHVVAGANCFGRRAFSLLEVMIACGIFFMAIFAILSLIASTLRNARSLRSVDVDAGMVAAQIYKTNKLYEGSESGDFGNAYPDYSWDTEITQAATNGLFQVDILVRRRGVQKPVDTMSIYVYAPDSPQNGGFGQPRFR
jgi:Tfp pilus assembly protein PilV